MMPNSENKISVVIPSYNHGHFIKKAIDSVLEQTYPYYEIVIIDDGSIDDTRDIVQNYGNKVNYFYKENGGLAAARNTGIEKSTGDFIVFLDADDWLYPNALQANLSYLLVEPKAAFVSGGHDKIFVERNSSFAVTKSINSDHYIHFLEYGNYIGVPACVMYRKWVLEQFRFDTTLKACEDFDLYLNISKAFPVVHHTEKVAAYRIHTSNMSADPILMLDAALFVLNRQRKVIRLDQYEKSIKKGVSFWKKYYCNELYKKIIHGDLKPTFKRFVFIFKIQPLYAVKYVYRKLTGKASGPHKKVLRPV